MKGGPVQLRSFQCKRKLKTKNKTLESLSFKIPTVIFRLPMRAAPKLLLPRHSVRRPRERGSPEHTCGPHGGMDRGTAHPTAGSVERAPLTQRSKCTRKCTSRTDRCLSPSSRQKQRDGKEGEGAKSTPNADSASRKGVWDSSENEQAHAGLEPMGAPGLSYTTLVRARFSQQRLVSLLSNLWRKQEHTIFFKTTRKTLQYQQNITT